MDAGGLLMSFRHLVGSPLLFLPTGAHSSEGASRIILGAQAAPDAVGGGLEGLFRAVAVGALLATAIGVVSLLVRREHSGPRDEIPHW
jgi:hypothetical protein